MNIWCQQRHQRTISTCNHHPTPHIGILTIACSKLAVRTARDRALHTEDGVDHFGKKWVKRSVQQRVVTQAVLERSGQRLAASVFAATRARAIMALY